MDPFWLKVLIWMVPSFILGQFTARSQQAFLRRYKARHPDHLPSFNKSVVPTPRLLWPYLRVQLTHQADKTLEQMRRRIWLYEVATLAWSIGIWWVITR